MEVKVFISQPMRDKTNKEIEKERNRVIKELEKKIGKDNLVILDSFFKDEKHEENPLWYLGKSIQLLAKADIVYFVKGWNNARGCRIEYNCCLEYGKEYVCE